MHGWDPQDNCHATSPDQQKWGFELLDKASLFGNEKVLDIGCGDGTITAEIARRVPNGSVLGIDKSEDRIRFAKDHFPAEKFPNLAFEVGDIRDLSFDGTFDVIFSNAVLHWIRDHGPLLERIKRSLKRGGRMLAQMGGKGNAAGILKVVEDIIAGKRWRRYFAHFSVPYTFCDVSEYQEWLKAAGFTARRIEAVPKTMLHTGKEGLSLWIRTTWLPYTRRVPEELRAPFIATIAEEYLKQQRLGNDDIIPVAMMRIELEAENPS